jgi:hypothetical protein
MYLVLSAFTSRPTSLLLSVTSISVFFMVLSCDRVTIDSVWIGNLIY